MIDIARLCFPDDDFTSAFQELGFSIRFTLETSGEPILVCDPNYLADVYNSEDEIASFVRRHGAFLMNFGGDSSCPVWWEPPFALFLLSAHLPDDLPRPPSAKMWVESFRA
jgi:hypothetical protein